MAVPPDQTPATKEAKDAGDRAPWRVEGERPAPPAPPAKGATQGRRPPSLWALLGILLLVNWLVSSWMLAPESRTEISYTFFRAQVEAGKVAEITSTEDAIEGRFTEEVTYPPGEKGEQVTRFSTHRPSFADDDLFQLLESKKVEVSARPTPGPSFLERLLVGFGPTILLVGLFVLLARRAGAGAGALGGLGKSRAQRYAPGAAKRVSFDDVAGIDDVEEEVAEIVDFLRNPDRYRRLGA